MGGVQGYQRSSAPGHFYVSAPRSSRFKSPLQRSRHPPSAPRSEHILRSAPALQACFLLRSSTPDLYCARGISAPALRGIFTSALRAPADFPALKTPPSVPRSEHILSSTPALQACFVLRSSAPDPPWTPPKLYTLLHCDRKNVKSKAIIKLIIKSQNIQKFHGALQ